jgi:sugar phosphate isomerase/epimerase
MNKSTQVAEDTGGAMKLGLIGIVHEEANADFWGTMERLAAMGYQGVETVERHLLDGDPATNLARFRTLGLEHLTVSADRDALRDRLDDIRRRAVDSGAGRVSVWWSEADSREGLRRDAELYNSAGSLLRKDGIKLCYHNHDQEFRNLIDGAYALDFLALNTDPAALFFNIDIGWVAVGGEDPARVLARLKGRVPAIHVKDFADLSDRKSFTAVGTGAVDIAGALQVAEQTGVEWAIVEQDTLRNLSAIETATAAVLHLRERGYGATPP